ncbi:MAG: hypothetical protein AMS16_04655 [Planctomycetes bacterium DG_58]|nr:MAG: hypothetical protein AMS16_04655 [Planctomycetes bacterium DG_58]KPL03100.1 MAG: hypothetical protein AMK75_01870 [Planctomycetes bacterium SM23_65]
MELGLAGWSLNRRFRAGQLRLLDYPQQVKEEFDLTVIELNSPFFESMEEGYVGELKSRIDAAGARVANIAVDGQGNLAPTDETERKQSVANYAAWFDVALGVGSPSIRAFSGGPHEGELTEELMQACITSFAELAVIGKEKGVKIIVENHGGVIARDPDNLVRLMQSDDSGFLGMCPDFGNFPTKVRYEGLEKVAPWAQVLHAKMLEFDETGEERRVDVKRCLDIFRSAGFDGGVLIEFEGKEDDHAGVLKSIELLRRYL